jgi:hypothetical protein
MATVTIEVRRLVLLVDPETHALIDRLNALGIPGSEDAAHRLRYGLADPQAVKIEGDIVTALFVAASSWLQEDAQDAGLDDAQRERIEKLRRVTSPVD